MKAVYIENRVPPPGISLTRDLTHHLYIRNQPGKALVITDKRDGVVAYAARQWRRIIRIGYVERASTLNSTRIAELNRQNKQMQRTRFVAKPPEKSAVGNVFFVLPSELTKVPADCHTVYLTCDIGEPAFERLVSMMPRHSLLVLYLAHLA